jgi:hypothetical protein
LSKKCGFSELCDRYIKKTSGKKLNLTICFFSECEIAQYLIASDSFVTLYQNMSDYINIELMTWTHTRVSYFFVYFLIILCLGRETYMFIRSRNYRM